MTNATVLVALGRAVNPVDLEPLCQAARSQNLHLRVRIVGAMPAIPVLTYGIGEFEGYAIPEGWQDEVEMVNEELERVRRQVAKYFTDQGINPEVGVIGDEPAALPETLARLALTCDLVVFGDELRKEDYIFRDMVHAALFHAPAGVILNGATRPATLQPAHILVAWKAGQPASRAVRAALPMLRAAEQVTICSIDPVTSRLRDGPNPGSDVAGWLSHHGCTVAIEQLPSGGEETGEVMQRRAREAGADLIVMGAYDHSRLREVVFGGTTRSMIEQSGVPVLLCH